MKLKMALTAVIAAAAALLTPGVSNADLPAGCTQIMEVRSTGIFWGSLKVGQVRLMAGWCDGGPKHWGKLTVSDDFVATGYYYKIRTGLEYNGLPMGEGVTSWAPDKQVVSTRTRVGCTTTLKAYGFVTIYDRPGGSPIITPWRETNPCAM